MTEPIQPIIEIKRKKTWPEIRNKALDIFKKHLEEKLLWTNFGWLKSDWIDEGFKMGVLGQPQVKETVIMGINYYKYYNYPLLFEADEETKYIKRGREREEVKKEKINIAIINQWFDFINYEREVEKEVNKRNFLS